MGEDWELFAAIVYTGSLSAAGRQAGLSPAMVSKRLARLEARLGARLVHRTTRRLVTTEAGRVFHDEAIAILAAANAAEARVAGGVDEPAGRLRVSAPTSFGRRHVAPHLAAFLVRHPAVALELDLTDDFVDLIGGRIDCAVRIGVAAGALVSTMLAPNRRLLCAAPAYLTAHGVPETLAELSRHHLLAADNQVPWRLDGPEGAVVLPVTSLVRTNSSEVARELALAGAGIALRSTWDVGDALAEGRLVRLLPDWEGACDVAIHAVRPKAPFVAPAVEAFVAHLAALWAPPPWDDRLGEVNEPETAGSATVHGRTVKNSRCNQGDGS
ncbi:LysR family transcriptional regulator [Sphingomonas sp.]|uniref:LysR family transcriptional regulator n=1 Tax=Sphingomonas sp. TaxID=28214 RepID=UPI003B000329